MAPSARAGEVKDRIGRHVGQPQRHAIARPDAEVGQPLGGAQRLLVQFGKGDRPIAVQERRRLGRRLRPVGQQRPDVGRVEIVRHAARRLPEACCISSAPPACRRRSPSRSASSSSTPWSMPRRGRCSRAGSDSAGRARLQGRHHERPRTLGDGGQARQYPRGMIFRRPDRSEAKWRDLAGGRQGPSALRASVGDDEPGSTGSPACGRRSPSRSASSSSTRWPIPRRSRC